MELAISYTADYMFIMEFDALAREVAEWPDEQVRRFQAFLVTLRHQRERGALDRLAAKLDDPNPARWISLESLEISKANR